MPELDRDGVRIWYSATGSGPAVLLSHGYAATSEMWAAQVDALSANHQVITWDMRGHGRSDSPDDASRYSEQLTTEDMAAILDACGADRAVIGGLSLGGYMSLAFHRRYPARTVALLLCDTGPGYRNPEARAGWNAFAERRAARLEQRGLAALGAEASTAGAAPPSAEVAVAHHRSAQGLALAARGMVAQVDTGVIDSLPSIAVPTLVLVGAADDEFQRPAEYMAARIPGATKVVIPDAGHAANLDQPEAFNRALVAFLDGLGA